MANSYDKGRHIGIKKFTNWLTVMQLKLIAKQGNQSISEEVKRRNILNHLPQYMEATLNPQIKEDWTCEHLVQQAESYEVSKRHIVVVTAQVRDRRYHSSNLYPNCIIRHMLTKWTDYPPGICG